jgi:hypothetical protein
VAARLGAARLGAVGRAAARLVAARLVAARRAAVPRAPRLVVTARRRPADVVPLNLLRGVSLLRGAALPAVPRRRPEGLPDRGGRVPARADRLLLRGAATATARRTATDPVPGRTHQPARGLAGHVLTIRDQRPRRAAPARSARAGELRINRQAGQLEDATPSARAAMIGPATGGAAPVLRPGRSGTTSRVTGDAAPARRRQLAATASRATGTTARDPVRVPGSVRAADPEQKGLPAGGRRPGRPVVPTDTVPTDTVPTGAGLREVAAPPGRADAAPTGSGLAHRSRRLAPGRPGRLCRACQTTSPLINWTLRPVLS